MSTTPSNWSRLASPSAATAGSRRRSISYRERRGFLERLGKQELRRRICHMAPGLLPFLLWPIPHKDPLHTILLQVILGLFAVIVVSLFFVWNRISRPGVGNGDRIAAIGGYAICVLATILLFPAHLECGLAVLGILAFGDGMATLCGKTIPSPSLPWNPKKTVAGLLAFVGVGTFAAMLIYWGESNNLLAIGPPATFFQAFLVALAGTSLAAIAETLPMRLNDNFRVGIAAAIGIVAAHAAIFGL